jgi:hypothetical protein
MAQLSVLKQREECSFFEQTAGSTQQPVVLAWYLFDFTRT